MHEICVKFFKTASCFRKLNMYRCTERIFNSSALNTSSYIVVVRGNEIHHNSIRWIAHVARKFLFWSASFMIFKIHNDTHFSNVHLCSYIIKFVDHWFWRKSNIRELISGLINSLSSETVFLLVALLSIKRKCKCRRCWGFCGLEKRLRKEK